MTKSACPLIFSQLATLMNFSSKLIFMDSNGTVLSKRDDEPDITHDAQKNWEWNLYRSYNIIYLYIVLACNMVTDNFKQLNVLLFFACINVMLNMIKVMSEIKLSTYLSLGSCIR